MNDDDLRDFFAGLAMLGQIMKRGYAEPSRAYEIADAMTKEKYVVPEVEPEEGIVAIKRKYRKKDET